MVDLVTQLREGVEQKYSRESLETMLTWAADEIERLRKALAESDQLIATHANSIDSSHPSTWPPGSLLAAAIKRHSEASSAGSCVFHGPDDFWCAACGLGLSVTNETKGE